MSDARRPSRALLVVAGLLTQVVGVACLIAALAALPTVHDAHAGTRSVIASAAAALGAIVCGTLIYRARLVPLALAMGIDVGFGIALPRGNSTIGALLRMLPEGDAHTAETLVTVAAIVMFAAGIACVLAIPSAVAWRRWARTRPAGTLRGVGPARGSTTQVVEAPPSRAPLVIVSVAIVLVGVGIVLILSSGGGRAAGEGSAVATHGSGSAHAALAVEAPPDAAQADAAVDAAEVAVAPEDFVNAFHAALALADPASLGALFDPKVFAIGVEANELAEGRDAVVEQLRHDIAAPDKGVLAVGASHTAIGREGDLAWLAEDLTVGGKPFLVTAALALAEGKWTIAAMHWAQPMPNETAYQLAREGNLATPDAIPDVHDTAVIATAMRSAFASRAAFVDARSTRPDAFNFGSALGERVSGGEAIKKIFARLHATIHLHDAVKIGTIGERGGWAAANVDFTDADKDGTEVTQTFRVLAVWLHEDAGWRIVQTQWSNPR